MTAALDVFDLLQPLREAGVLGASDVHIAAALARLGGCDDETVALAAALAARAPRVGHTCVDLGALGSVDPPIALPELDAWTAAISASPLTRGPDAPLVLDGNRLYLHRYWAYEQAVSAHLATRAVAPAVAVEPSPDVLDALLTGEGAAAQCDAVVMALHQSLTVLVGGPGTGKTTTVAALLACLTAHDPSTRIALAAPTGKAAARLGEALRAAAGRLPAPLAERIATAEASTIHRLLGTRGGRFLHGRDRPLPHDVVIVDETSMVSLPLMARLLDAVRPQARLVLVGDPAQLTSVEAGTVLGDLSGPIADPAVAEPRGGPLSGHTIVLRHSRRFPPGSPLDRFAGAVRRGDARAALAVLTEPCAEGNGAGALDWHASPADHPGAVERVRALAVPVALEVAELAAAGDAAGALGRLGQLRVLCAHRDGPFGVGDWNHRVEAALAASGSGVAGWYPGRPVLVTANDYVNLLYNGDLGVVVRRDDRLVVAFADHDGVRSLAPSRLQSVETVHAMTIHKSQGSEFDHVVVVLPPAESPLASRELLYTAVTRARLGVTLVGDEASVVAAIERRVARAGGLGALLWPGGARGG